MIALLQRVRSAHVTVDEKITGQITHGVLVFLCAQTNDTPADADKLLERILNYRMFADSNGKMNQSNYFHLDDFLH